MRPSRTPLNDTAQLIRSARTETAFPQGLVERVRMAVAVAPRSQAPAGSRRLQWRHVIEACALAAVAVLVVGVFTRWPTAPPPVRRAEQPATIPSLGVRVPEATRASSGRQSRSAVRQPPAHGTSKGAAEAGAGLGAASPEKREQLRTLGPLVGSPEEVGRTRLFLGDFRAAAGAEIPLGVEETPSGGLIAMGHSFGETARGLAADYGLDSSWSMTRQVGSEVRTDAIPRRAAAVRRLIGLLSDPDWVARSVCAQMLGELMDPAAIEPLILCLQDTHPDVRGSAAHALGVMGATGAVGPLIAALEREDGLVWEGPAVCVPTSGNYHGYPLISALAEIQDARAVPALSELLERQDPRIRAAAAYALGMIGDKAAADPLLAALADTDDRVRTEAAAALGRIGDPRAVPALVAALADAERRVHGQVVWALGELGAEEAVEPLIADLQADDLYRRTDAARALGRIGDQRALEPLTARLPDTEDSVRSAAAEAIPQVRLGAMHALRQQGSDQATAVAANPLQQEDPELRSAAMAFLAEFATPAGMIALEAALSHPDPAVRYRAALALGRTTSPRGVEVLLEALQRGDPRTQWDAARLLGELHDTRAVEPLIAALASDDWSLLQNAAEALGKIGDPRAVAPILALVNRGDNALGGLAPDALFAIGDSSAVEGLVEIMTGKDAEIRPSAAFALGVLGDAHAQEALVRALQDDEPLGRLRHAAALALIQQGWKPADRAQRMRYLVALERWEEAAQISSAIAALPSRQRAEGGLEFDIPIIVPVKAESEGRSVIVAHWIEFAKSSGNVNATLFMTTSSWPKSSWRISLDLLDGEGNAVSHADTVHETEGTVLGGIAMQRALSQAFDLGPWSKVSRATRFAVSVEQLMPGKGP